MLRALSALPSSEESCEDRHLVPPTPHSPVNKHLTSTEGGFVPSEENIFPSS